MISLNSCKVESDQYTVKNKLIPYVSSLGRAVRTVPVVFIALLPFDSSVARPVFSLGYSGGYDSNPALVSTDERSNVSHSLFASVAGQTQGSRVTTLADFRLGYEDGNNTDGQLIGTGGAVVDVVIRPSRFHWSFRDTLSQTLLSNLESSIDPDNSDLRNTFTTGPQLFFDITPRNHLTLSAEYSRTFNDEASELDSEEKVGNLDFTHDLSERSQTGYSYTYRESNLVDAPVNEVTTKLENASVFFNTQRRRHRVRAEVGFGRDVNAGFDTETGSLDWDYQLNSRVSLSVGANKSLSTAAAIADGEFLELTNQFNATSAACTAGLISGPSCTLPNRLSQANLLLGDVFLVDETLARALFEDSVGSQEFEQLSFTIDWSPTSVHRYAISLFSSRQIDVLEEEAAALLDPDRQESEGVTLSANYAFSERTNFDIGLTHTIRTSITFEPVTSARSESEFTEQILRASLGYRMARNIESQFGLHYSNADREGSDPVTDSGGDGYGLDLTFAWTF